MKKINPIHLLFTVVLILVFSCDKAVDNLSLRITKVADNQAMEDPWYTFEYNTDGTLKSISDVIDVVYNSNKLPIRLTSTYFDGINYIENFTDIEWVANGFIITNENESDSHTDTYELDSSGRVIKRTSVYAPVGGDPITKILVPEWIGNDILNIDEYEETFKYINKKNPFSNLNLAIVIADELEYGEWEVEFQNKFCISEWTDGGLSAEVTYQFNKQGYPIVADIKYTSGEGTFHDYIYFEYESY